MSKKRKFLIAVMFGLLAVAMCGRALTFVLASKIETIRVDDFGAVGDGVTDDIAAVADAIDALKAAGSGATLEFTSGKTYRMGRWNGSMYHIDLQGMTNVTVNGNGAMLLSTPYNAPIRVQNCSHVAVKDLVIEESPLAYSQGVITYIEPTGEYFEMETLPEFPLTLSLQFGYWNWGSIIDPVLKRIRAGEKDHYYVDSIAALSTTNTFRVTVIDDEFTRTRLKNEGQIGDIWFQPLHFNSHPRLALIDGSRGDPNIWVTQSSDILMEDITLYSGRSSMCNTISDNDGPITYRRFRVEIPESETNRVVSVWRDGMHCINNRVGPVIEDCYFSAMLDDSINLSQSTSWAAEVVAGTDNKTFRLTDGWVTCGSHAVGDQIRVFHPATGEYVGPVAVVGVDALDPSIITLESSITNVVVQGELNASLFYNMDMCNEGAVVRGNVFMPQRRHAILLRSPKCIIENNLMDSVGGNGVYIASSGDGEGPFPEDIIVRNNRFKSTYLSPIRVGAIFGDVNTRPVNHIEISNNELTVAETPAVELENVDWISIKKNQFKNADGSELLVEITESTHVFLSDTDLLDAGFESAFSDPDGNGFEFRPDGPPWTFVGLAGYSEASTAFTSGNPSPPEGSQVLLLKGASRASQNLFLDAGTYTLSFSAAQRKNSGSQVQQVEVFVDGVSLGVFQPPSDGTYEYFERTFTVPARGTVLLKMKNRIAADETIFLDEMKLVRNAQLSGLEDGGFESAFSDPDGNGFEFRPEGLPWTFAGLAGYSEASTSFAAGNPQPPEGEQVLLLKAVARVSQTVLLDAGTYTLHFRAAQRKNFGSQIQQVEVFVDEGSIGTFQPPATGVYEYFEKTFAVSAAGSHVFKLQSLVADDETVFVDDLGIVPADDVVVR